MLPIVITWGDSHPTTPTTSYAWGESWDIINKPFIVKNEMKWPNSRVEIFFGHIRPKDLKRRVWNRMQSTEKLTLEWHYINSIWSALYNYTSLLNLTRHPLCLRGTEIQFLRAFVLVGKLCNRFFRIPLPFPTYALKIYLATAFFHKFPAFYRVTSKAALCSKIILFPRRNMQGLDECNVKE